MNKQRRKDIDGGKESGSAGKDLISEQSTIVTEIATDLRGGTTSGIRTRLVNLKSVIDTAAGKLDDARSIMETAKDEEQEYYDNMPENMQNGDKGSNAQTAIDALESAESAYQEAQEAAEGISSQLEEMIGPEDRAEWEQSDADYLDSITDTIGEIENKVEEAEGHADEATSA